MKIDVGKIEWEVKDDFLSPEEFKNIKSIIMGKNLPWNYNESTNPKTAMRKDDIYFTHTFYMGLADKPSYDDDGKIIPPEKSSYYEVIEPIIEKLPHQILMRIKSNLYARTESIRHHPTHVYTAFPHRGAIFYLNTNNGLTILDDKTEISSVANRMLFFDPSKPHHSTTCTDEKYRANININYL